MSAIIYRFRVTFEDVDEVERVIEIKAGDSFAQFHKAIQDAIGFDHSKPASFYLSGDNWRMGKEISTEKDRGAAEMDNARLNQFVNDPHQRFLYISDFEANWTLRVELVRISRSDDHEFPKLIRSTGEAPKQYKPKHASDLNEFDEMVNELIIDEETEKQLLGEDEDFDDLELDDDGEDDKIEEDHL